VTERAADCLALILCARLNCVAQQQSEAPSTVLRVETSAVAVDLIVTDRRGHHVPGLTATDFRLFEDNTPQKIASFIPPPGRAERLAAAGHESPAVEING